MTIKITADDGGLSGPQYLPYESIIPASLSFGIEGLTGTVTSIDWDFGDGEGSSLRSPLHTYNSHGHNRVTLSATHGGGTESDEGEVVLAKLDFDASPRSGSVPLAVDFEDKSEAPAGYFLDEYAWDFGDTQSVTGIQNPTHIYVENGDFNVTLSAKLST